MNKEFNKGLLLAGFGSFWWGFFGVLYFKYITFIGYIELVVHRCLWTTLTLILTTFFFSKWDIFFKIIKSKQNLVYLFMSGFLIFMNWGVWIYAIATNRIIDASFGYFIMPILSVLLGYIFFKEKLNNKRIFSITLVILSILYLIFVSLKSLPWVGILAIGAFYLIAVNGYNDFSLSNPPMMLIILLAGPMTVIPLFLYVRGVELCGLGPTGMIFYITPTLQFLLGFFYYDEVFSFNKLVSFILIWIAVIIYLRDLYETN